MFKAADLMEARADEIVKLQSLEMGGPIGPAHKGPHPMISRSAWNFRFFAEEQELAGNHAFNRDDSLLTYTMCDPVGVYGLITPWNGPFMLSTWKMAPCLAYGNTAVHKPSELSPLSIHVLCEIFQEAGMPAGTYNMVLGYGHEAGVPLVEHDDVAGISFTGSPATARDIASRAATSLKRTSFELGGKSANIIFADANLEKAIPAAAASIFMNAGQACVAGSRILVQRPIFDEFLAGFEKAAGAWKPGNPFDRTTRLGPLVHKRQYDRVMGYLDTAREEGRILFGGGRPEGLDSGYFVAPTAIVDVDNSARVCQEEIFGPVAVIMPFDDADHALEIANDSSYGLAGYIWTESQTTAHYVNHRLRTAMIWINAGFDRDLRQPFGGLKQSGLGREGGNFSREFYTETRFTSFPLTPR
jgi:aminomuconate-semialdehyde/2-hydroxymuconate-6-semialdehyde dehydrogenase